MDELGSIVYMRIYIHEGIVEKMQLKTSDVLDIEIKDDPIVLRKKFVHKSFEERLAEYNGEISVCDFDWGEPAGREISGYSNVEQNNTDEKENIGSDHKPSMIGPMLIILAGCFWGSMGIFVRRLAEYGFSSMQIVSIRVTLAALIFALVLFIKDRTGFKISPRDIPLFLGLGFGSILFFTVCYFTAITMMTLSAAAILLYTSPVWIMLMSVMFFHEKLDRRKLIALALAFAGCVLVSGISGEGITVTGLLVGLGSGIGYGLYSILGTIALRRYSSYTVTTYTFMFAAAGSWIICRPADMFYKFSNAADLGFLMIFCCLTALITAVIPFLAYTLGLERVEASKAGIIATIEPMVATLIGIVVFSEPLTIMSAAGILLILSAVVILNSFENV